MARYVVDASVAVEYLLQTRLGNMVESVLMTSDLIAPEVFDLEVLAALRGFALRDEVPLGVVTNAIDQLADWDVTRFPHRRLLHQTWGYYRNVSTYDAIYVALAKDFDTGVITADSKLARAPTVDVAVYDVRDVNVLAWLETR